MELRSINKYLNNRTFKVYGQATSAIAVLTVGGVEVFNGEVASSLISKDIEQPNTNNFLFEYELEQDIIGQLSYSLQVTGSELCLGRTEYNQLPDSIIDPPWMAANFANYNILPQETQQTLATRIGEHKLGKELYVSLLVGTLSQPTAEQRELILDANDITHPADIFRAGEIIRTNPQINGEIINGWGEGDNDDVCFCPIIPNGSTFTCTINLDPTTTITI